jgi:hypothetical protein
MATTDQPLRVVQWTTGKVASEAVKAIAERPDLELLGVFAFSKEKVGQDAGELTNLGRSLGVTATDDIDALIALKPDCVIYMPRTRMSTTSPVCCGRGSTSPRRPASSPATRTAPRRARRWRRRPRRGRSACSAAASIRAGSPTWLRLPPVSAERSATCG